MIVVTRIVKATGLLIGLLTITAISCAQKPGYDILTVEPVDLKRVEEIATMLPDNPKGFGDPIQVRKRWNELFSSGKFSGLLEEADSIYTKPFPKLTPEIYLKYYLGRDSETSKRFIMNRRRLLTVLVWAECLTNTGKYMPAILGALEDIVGTTSWSFPAEDTRKTNYEGKLYTIGLSSASYGYEMAQTLYLLSSKLDSKLQDQIMASLYKKVFNPTLNAIKNNNANGEFTSLINTGNHNPVMLAGVTAAALTVVKDKKERAIIVAIAERYSNNYIVGFTDDGYCSEGINYYGYGLGHYIMLRESLFEATAGRIDILARPRMREIARFVPAMEIINGVYATIGDCEQNIQPTREVMYYLNRNFALGLKKYDTLGGNFTRMSLSNIMYFFPGTGSTVGNVPYKQRSRNLRDYFSRAGVLTVRPATNSRLNMGATFKGGNNNEQHNHNDLGSYSIVVGKELVMGDPGLATYTPTYFKKERYAMYKTTASYGHPVPLVSDIQQSTGPEAHAKITATVFSDHKDVFIMDITSAYVTTSLKKLQRSFTYYRKSDGYIAVKDDFEFDSKQSFETALITRAQWKLVAPDQVEFTMNNEKLYAKIIAPKHSFTVTTEEIDEGPTPFTRIAVKLKDAVEQGSVTIMFKPHHQW